ncbi:unnamed protein product, partial [Amoebophrya sp. A120]
QEDAVLESSSSSLGGEEEAEKACSSESRQGLGSCCDKLLSEDEDQPTMAPETDHSCFWLGTSKATWTKAVDNVAQKLYPLGSIQRTVYRSRVAEIEEQYRNARINSPKETSSSASGSSSSQLNSSPAAEDASSATSRSPTVPAQAQGNGKIENIKSARSCAAHDKTSLPSSPSPPCFASAPSSGVDFFEPNGTHLNLEFEDLSDLLHDKSTFGKGSLE